jgi:hypothetical protein
MRKLKRRKCGARAHREAMVSSWVIALMAGDMPKCRLAGRRLAGFR